MIWYLILLAVIVVLLILGGTLLFVRKYQHPDEVNKAWHCKILVVRWKHPLPCTPRTIVGVRRI
jgi:hypothetical protein